MALKFLKRLWFLFFIYSGIFSSTQAASISIFYTLLIAQIIALFLCILFRQISLFQVGLMH